MLNDPCLRIADSADCADSADKESEARNFFKKNWGHLFSLQIAQIVQIREKTVHIVVASCS